MGPGGPRGLQNRCRARFLVRGGFDSHALPPPYDISPLRKRRTSPYPVPMNAYPLSGGAAPLALPPLPFALRELEGRTPSRHPTPPRQNQSFPMQNGAPLHPIPAISTPFPTATAPCPRCKESEMNRFGVVIRGNSGDSVLALESRRDSRFRGNDGSGRGNDGSGRRNDGRENASAYRAPAAASSAAWRWKSARVVRASRRVRPQGGAVWPPLGRRICWWPTFAPAPSAFSRAMRAPPTG